MDRQLTVEFPWLVLKTIAVPSGNFYKLNPPTDVRALSSDRLYVAEQKIDLSGYVQDNLTVGFRRSFEQKGGSEFITWKQSYDPSSQFTTETILVSSVPLNDDQMLAATVGMPGFTNFAAVGVYDWGNFNREHIIHGSYKIYYPNSVIGSGAFTSSGSATMLAAVDNYFSSLEPTAADCLYCYRIMNVPDHGDLTSGIQNITLPPVRVILDAFTVEEPDLEYMMRLKRSYELANQV